MYSYYFESSACSIVCTIIDRACHSKCISTRYAEGDLTKGEMVCIDRCVSKYNEVQTKVGEQIQSHGAQMGAGRPGGGFGL
jgi:mitochondrial import inner membrane translocase subunit TIM10